MNESEATFIGKDDDSKTIWKGKSISYFLSGTKSAEIMRDDAGNLNGLSVRYFENSNKKEELNFKEIIKSCIIGNFRIDWRLFNEFKKDFWKEFI